MPKKTKQRLVVIFMTVLGILSLGAVIFFLTLPSYQRADQLAENIREAQAELEAQYENRRDLVESSARIKRIKTTVERLESQFVDPGEELTFITRVEDIGEERGVDTRITLGSSGGSGDGPERNDLFEVRFGGFSRDVLDAIADLERLEILLLTRSVQIVAGPVESGTSTVSATLKGRIPFTPEDL